jgi:hypothetical protein
MMTGNKIVLVGIEQTIADLKKFDEDAVKKFNKTINDELRSAKNEARVIVAAAGGDGAPLSHWGTSYKMGKRGEQHPENRPWPIWQTGQVVSGIVSSRAQGKVRKDYTTSAGALINKSRAGAIFEIAGRVKGEGKNPQGTAFKKMLREKYGEASRVVFRVVDKNRAKIEAKFVFALEEAKATLQKNLESR